MNTFKDEQKRFLKWLKSSAGGGECVDDYTETDMLNAWLAGQGLEFAPCLNCKSLFIRHMSSKPKRYCDAERCQKIQKIKNSIVTYGNVPNFCSPYRCDIDYHGSVMD